MPWGTASGWTPTKRPCCGARERIPDPALVPGMVVTIEPGLYDTAEGGVRWENDVLVTAAAPRVLTRSRIVRVP